jgi:hypothetical protein
MNTVASTALSSVCSTIAVLLLLLLRLLLLLLLLLLPCSLLSAAGELCPILKAGRAAAQSFEVPNKRGSGVTGGWC